MCVITSCDTRLEFSVPPSPSPLTCTAGLAMSNPNASASNVSLPPRASASPPVSQCRGMTGGDAGAGPSPDPASLARAGDPCALPMPTLAGVGGGGPVRDGSGVVGSAGGDSAVAASVAADENAASRLRGPRGRCVLCCRTAMGVMSGPRPLLDDACVPGPAFPLVVLAPPAPAVPAAAPAGPRLRA